MVTLVEIFVFGSNLAGRHGKGAALHARQHYGAKNGQGEGRHGNSYAIPTKRTPWETLPLDVISGHVATFKRYAWLRQKMHLEEQFLLTPIGCGLAGYTPEQIAPMFADAPSNVVIPPEFLAILRGYRR